MSASKRCRVAVVSAAATLMLLGGCTDDDSTDAGATAEQTTSTAPTPNATPSATASSSTTDASALAGTWKTESLSIEDLVATIGREGLDKWTDDFRANAPFSADSVLELSIGNGEWDLYGVSTDGQREPIDFNAECEIDGDTVIVKHSDGANTFHWKVDGDTLRLEFVSTTLPGYEGIPDEVYQRALYMTAAFTKAT